MLPMSDVSPAPEKLSAAILDREVGGVGLRTNSLRAELGARATHVVFLRHFG